MATLEQPHTVLHSSDRVRQLGAMCSCFRQVAESSMDMEEACLVLSVKMPRRLSE